MVQVDVFWAYAFGAGFSLAAFRQLKKKEDEASSRKDGQEKRNHLFENMYFIKAILYIAVLFVPSGAYLLWGFPSWETMHVGSYATIPAWVVALFVMTMPLMAVLGFWAVYRLVKAGKYYAAGLQPFLGYFFMFFILVNGWDKNGFKRFFSATKENFANWPTGFGEQFAAIKTWLVSDVALTLYGMGVILIPVLLIMLTRWLYEGYETGYLLDTDRYRKVNPLLTCILLLLAVFGGSLGLAIIAALLITYAGWIWGTLLFLVVAYILGIRLFFRFICRWVMLVDSF
ncbi:MAG: hypothetical protein GX883_10010 [Firmicutes bacterium]|nr:hypothetical protein [Bacillota bacterium]